MSNPEPNNPTKGAEWDAKAFSAMLVIMVVGGFIALFIML